MMVMLKNDFGVVLETIRLNAIAIHYMKILYMAMHNLDDSYFRDKISLMLMASTSFKSSHVIELVRARARLSLSMRKQSQHEHAQTITTRGGAYGWVEP